MYPNGIFWTKFIFHCSISLNFSKFANHLHLKMEEFI